MLALNVPLTDGVIESRGGKVMPREARFLRSRYKSLWEGVTIQKNAKLCL